jgi:hypothetical protein
MLSGRFVCLLGLLPRDLLILTSLASRLGARKRFHEADDGRVDSLWTACCGGA